MAADLNLAEWIQAQKAIVRTERGPLVRLVLRHVVAESQPTGANVLVVECDGDMQPTVAAVELDDAAQRDADNYGGPQSYNVLAFFGEGADSLARYPLRKHGAELDDQGPTEGANPRGLVGQSMRHTEALMRMSVGQAHSTIQQLQRMVSEAHDEISRMRKERFQLYETVESLLTTRSEREAIDDKARLSREIKTNLYRDAKQLFPVVANRIAGKTVFPEGEPPIVALARTVVAGLNDEQVAMFAEKMEPAQRIAFLELVEQLANVRDDRRDGGTNGAPAAGGQPS